MFKKNRTNIILTSLLFILCLFSFTVFAGKIQINNGSNSKDQLTDLYEIDLDGEDRVYLDIGGADVYFDEDLENIYISDELNFDKRGGRINIFYPKKSLFDWFNHDHVVVIGTKKPYKLIDIDAGGTNLSGTLNTDRLKINSGGLDMSGKYTSREIKINGAGIDIDGFINSEYMKINGAGMDLDLDVIGLKEFVINGAGLDVKVKYFDSWVGSRSISANGVGGELVVILPSNNNKKEDGYLDIDTSGFIETEVDYY